MWTLTVGLGLILVLVVVASVSVTKLVLGGFFKWMARAGKQV